MKLEINFLKILFKTTLIILLLSSKVSASSIDGDFNKNLRNYNSKLTIFDKKNNQIASFKVIKASSNEQKAYGLMNLRKLDAKYGMIFIFHEPRIINMWMKNTYIPLDMIFIDEHNKIVKIQKNTEPHSLKIISSGIKASKTLEINANLSDKFKIKIGHTINLQ